jgi:pantoate kinase
MKNPTQNEVDEVVMAIMVVDGPDGHIDGHEVITDYVMALLVGKGDEWADAYLQRPEVKASLG